MKVGFIGTGLMGFPMTLRLLEKGHELIVYNRTVSKTESLARAGAKVAISPSEVFKQAECIIFMVTDSKAIGDILSLETSDIDFRERVVIQMGTIAPQDSKLWQQKITERHGEYLECPVLGSRKETSEARLILMVGSSQDQFERWRSFLECFGSDPVWVGPVGRAAALKLAMNQLIASLMTAFAQSLSFVQQMSIPEDLFMSVLRKSALYTPAFDKKLPRLKKYDYSNPNFPVKHMVKDLNLFISTAKDLGIDVTAVQGVKDILDKTVQIGKADEDYCALFETVRSVSKTEGRGLKTPGVSF